MEAKAVKLGSSLPVPSVQELAKEVLTAVPPRYIRLNEPQTCEATPVSEEEVPVVDMQRLLSEDSMDSELARLHHACKEWGFFQLVNHGVSSSLLDEVKKGIQEFFELPKEEKKKFWMGSGDLEGFGQHFVLSEEQKLDWADMFFMICLPLHMRKPHLFPKIPLPFRDALESYSSELKTLALAVLAHMAKALKMEAEEMRDVFENGMQSMRMNYYPPCPEPEKVFGLTPHSDFGGLTILLEANDVKGLQIKKDGKWVSVKPLPCAFIVNLGDVLEIISNGTYNSMEHRAMVNSAKERISIATFYNPSLDAEVGPAKSLISEQSPAMFKRRDGLQMETKEVSLGGSLLVPSVQELVKDGIITIPPQYIRTEQDLSQITEASAAMEVPVIDLQSLLSGESMDSELARLHFACKEWGFFQLVNHGVCSFLLDKVKKGAKDLFNLPMEEKKKFWQKAGDVEGFGQAFVVSEEQKLDWGDIFFMITLPTHMRKPHLFPNLPLPFRDVLEVYSKSCKNLAMTILAQMAKALKMNDEEMKEIFESGRQSMRMNYYPPCPEPEKVMGLTPHSDAVALTILLQVNQVEGLQIRKDGRCVPIKPLPNAFVVNIGDVLEIITNGAYRSIEHRAVVNSDKERISIATFYNPRYDGEIGPANSLVNDAAPPLFRRVSSQEYFRGLFARELRGRSYLDVMRISVGQTEN